MYSIIIILSFLSCSIPLTSTATSSSQDFTFSQPQSFLRVQPDWPLTKIREVKFHFKTVQPHGLLLYHGLINPPIDNYPHYEMYLMLENARLRFIHVFDQDNASDSYYVGKGLNKDKWHNVRLIINPGTANLFLSVDDDKTTETLPSLIANPYYNLNHSVSNSFLYFGGTNAYSPILNRQYNYVRFVGCLGNITFGHSENSMEPVTIESFYQTEEGCSNRCKNEDWCLHGGRCVNHYKRTICDCFGTGHEGPICQNNSLTTITLRGYSYLTYRIYYWKDRVQSEANMLSLLFRTYVADSVLLYGAGGHPEYNYIAISIFQGELYFEIDFGDGPMNTTLGYLLHDEIWHNITMIHHGKIVKVMLDNRHITILEATEKHHLHLDPEVYIGGAPPNAKGVKSHKKFVGCLKELYFNRKNILFSLHETNSAVRHYGIFLIEYGCSIVDVIPLTFRLRESRLLLNQTGGREFDLTLEFKTFQRECVLASGFIQMDDRRGYWEMYLQRGTAFFVLLPNENDTQNKWTISEGTHLSNNYWHHINVKFKNESNTFEMKIDFRYVITGVYNNNFKFTSDIVIGSEAQNIIRGFVGCMRDIYINKAWLDPRGVIGTEFAKGKVSLDNCQLVNPCNNPQACEHGGKCIVENGDTKCNCTGTGYTGKTCHFSIYKRTCEELYLVGYRQTGSYKIDIDRNGPLPPAHVTCMMNEKNDYIVTRVLTNMQPEMVIRKSGMEGFYFDITYQEFTPPMLQSLITHSKQCTQDIKYECFKMPLGLRTYTWMESSASGHYVTTIGSKLSSGRCPCSESRSCANSSLMCNCDISDARWRVDESTFTDRKDLGITRVYILQPPNTAADAEARLSIGQLDCVETDTQQYVITFKTPVSSVEVPGWYRGDMAFSFRTSNSKAVLVYQAAVHTTYGYFRVLLINDYELSFEYTVNGKPENVIVKSGRKLNTGEWQQVWVDHDTHHMRFTVNSHSEMRDLGEEEEAGPFEGRLFVGGVPKKYAGDSTIKEGFIGCFRGLVIGDSVINLHEHLIKSSPDIVVNCQPSCSPNPCKNGATCLEYWGSYECKCLNPFAHSGKNCEENININGITFLTSNSFFHNKTNENETYFMSPVLEQDILLSFRTYEKKALLLYANDHLNNFVQLHFDEGKRVLFTFNSDRSVVQGIVEIPGISKGLPVQIKLSRNKDKTILIVNNKQSVINRPMKFVETYRQDPWLEGQDIETVKPPRGNFPTIPHAEMFLGSVGKGTVSYLPGFVGCMQGLKIGNSVFDLEKAALQKSDFSGQLRPGCKMLCDEMPCQNGGICIEDWKNNYTNCDCALTSYTGDACQKDIGGIFDGKSTATYTFNLPPTAPDTVNIRLAFSIDSTSEVRQALLFIQIAQSTKYILASLTPEGSLLIEEDRESDGIIRKIIKKSGNSFADNHRHWIYYTRSMDQIKLIVDGEEHIPTIQQVVDLNEKSIETSSKAVIGGTQSRDHRFVDYGNFHGCISNVIIELGGFYMKPLETVFGYNKVAMEKVKTEGPPTEGKCASFGNVITSSTEAPGIPHQKFQPWKPDPPIKIKYKTIYIETEANKLQKIMESSIKTAIVMAVFFLLVMFALMLYIWKIQKRHKKRQLRAEMLFFQGRRGTSNQNKTANFGTPGRYVEFSYENQPLASSESNEVNVEQKTNHSKSIMKNHQQNLENNNETQNNNLENVPLLQNKDEMDLPELPLQPSSSQELEWDPAADNADLITTAMNEMNPDEMEDNSEDIENPGPLRSQILRNVPLASASEVTINRLSQTFT